MIHYILISPIVFYHAFYNYFIQCDARQFTIESNILKAPIKKVKTEDFLNVYIFIIFFAFASTNLYLYNFKCQVANEPHLLEPKQEPLDEFPSKSDDLEKEV